MAAVSFRHFFVLQSFAPFIFRTESLDLLPLRRSALPHMHHPHPAGGRPGSSSQIGTVSPYLAAIERLLQSILYLAVVSEQYQRALRGSSINDVHIGRWEGAMAMFE